MTEAYDRLHVVACFDHREVGAVRDCPRCDLDTPRESAESRAEDAVRAEVTRENADLLIGMWHNMEFGHPHKDGMRQASTILYNLAAASDDHEATA